MPGMLAGFLLGESVAPLREDKRQPSGQIFQVTRRRARPAATPGAAPDQVAYYIDVLRKVRETPEWKALMNEGAFNQTFMTGGDFAKWLSGEESRHRQLMQEAGFLAGN
jgi:tripartite-type tricarboxylate transporter receptor subunit TctC